MNTLFCTNALFETLVGTERTDVHVSGNQRRWWQVMCSSLSCFSAGSQRLGDFGRKEPTWQSVRWGDAAWIENLGFWTTQEHPALPAQCRLKISLKSQELYYSSDSVEVGRGGSQLQEEVEQLQRSWLTQLVLICIRAIAVNTVG